MENHINERTVEMVGLSTAIMTSVIHSDFKMADELIDEVLASDNSKYFIYAMMGLVLGHINAVAEKVNQTSEEYLQSLVMKSYKMLGD